MGAAMKHSFWAGLPLAVASAAAFSSASAADVEAGKAQARQACAVCHGQIGISIIPNTPHLAGQPALYLAEQLRQYRSGERKHEVMTIIAGPLTDEQIDNLSEWYQSIVIDAREP